MLIFKLLLAVLGVAVAAYLAAGLSLYLRQTRLIFFPTAAIEATPADLEMQYEDVWLPVDQEQIHGWWIPAVGHEAGVVLYLHGNGINIGANLGQAQRFHQLNLSVLLIDYRGYGRSQGSFPSEQRVYQDAATAWQYLTQTRKIPAQRIFIYGHSLGGAIAINLASQQPDAAGLIVQSSFTSMRQMVDQRMPRSIFPIDLLLTQRFDSLSKVPRLKLPVLYVHGIEDDHVPAFMSQILYSATLEPKRLYLVPIAGHNNVGETAGAAYLQVIQTFVQQHLQPASSEEVKRY